MGPSAAAVSVLAVVASGCLGVGKSSSGDGHPNLVTRSSLAGILGTDTPSDVESILGKGDTVNRVNHPLEIEYQGGVLTVYYYPRDDPKVFLVKTTSPRFRTASGVGVGSGLPAVKALGRMDCSSDGESGVECLTHSYSTGLRFDLVNNRVTRLWLVQRTE